MRRVVAVRGFLFGRVVAVLLALALLPSTHLAYRAAAAQASSTSATAFQTDSQHDGDQPSETISPPYVVRWSLDLGDHVSYPIIVNGTAYVTYTQSQQGTKSVVALDASTGATRWGPVQLPAQYSTSDATYDNGRLFFVDVSGIVRAYDASTGSALWTQTITSSAETNGFRDAPIAANGVLYLCGGVRLVAMRESDGATMWNVNSSPIADSWPVVTSSAVYIADGAGNATAYSLSGSLLWQHTAQGSNLGVAPAYHSGSLYVAVVSAPQSSEILDAQTGQTTGQVAMTVAPAFDGSDGFFLDGNTLSAVDLNSGATLWTFTGDGNLVTPPTAANGVVYVGSGSGELYALNETNGATTWKVDVGAPFLTPQWDLNGTGVLSANAVAAATVFALASGRLVAYAKTSGTPPQITSVDPAQGDPSGGTSTVIIGRGFTGATQVLFGNLAASSYQVVWDGQINAVSPPHATGAVHISITTPLGTTTAAPQDYFEYFVASPSPGDSALTFQMDVAHSGTQSGDSLRVSSSTQLQERWRTPIAACPPTSGGGTNSCPASYPLIAGGRVFVVRAVGGSENTWLTAIDEASGAILWGPTSLGSQQTYAATAYDGSSVFALADYGTLSAFDSASGAVEWSTQLTTGDAEFT
ncbi:MAG: PQQ-binding-like beta-propeller repeat protein, partial [Candidatus Dormibacteraeota bacterium]|nr:PQQ-binding-like beta-propeller repeat protein [Candidatus Dormibacteraeota bacterium]